MPDDEALKALQAREQRLKTETFGWTYAIGRRYNVNADGFDDFEDDRTILEAHGYRADEDTGSVERAVDWQPSTVASADQSGAIGWFATSLRRRDARWWAWLAVGGTGVMAGLTFIWAAIQPASPVLIAAEWFLYPVFAWIGLVVRPRGITPRGPWILLPTSVASWLLIIAGGVVGFDVTMTAIEPGITPRWGAYPLGLMLVHVTAAGLVAVAWLAMTDQDRRAKGSTGQLARDGARAAVLVGLGVGFPILIGVWTAVMGR